MQNAGLDEAETGIKIAGRNINNFSYVDDTTLMADIFINHQTSVYIFCEYSYELSFK